MHARWLSLANYLLASNLAIEWFTCLPQIRSRNRMVYLPQIPQSNAFVKKCNCSCSGQTLWLFCIQTNILSSSFNFCPNFAKFGPEKSDFHLYKGFFKNGKKKWAQIRQFSRILFYFSKSPNFYDKVPVGSQEYWRNLVFRKLSYLVLCSQIWVNCLMDDRHFSSYITKLKIIIK
jgi:hypothetical protein